MSRERDLQRQSLHGGAWALGLALAVVIVVLGLLAQRAHGHPLRPTARHMTLAQRERFQLRVLRHDAAVLRFFTRHPRLLYSAGPATRRRAWAEVLYHRAQRRWTTRELGETRDLLRARLGGDAQGGGRWLITAYCLSGTTATGTTVGPGTVAVDPSVIPLHSRVYVEGYGPGVALDTGSAVKGHHVDVWIGDCHAAYISTHYGSVRWSR